MTYFSQLTRNIPQDSIKTYYVYMQQTDDDSEELVASRKRPSFRACSSISSWSQHVYIQMYTHFKRNVDVNIDEQTHTYTYTGAPDMNKTSRFAAVYLQGLLWQSFNSGSHNAPACLTNSSIALCFFGEKLCEKTKAIFSPEP